MKRKQKNNQKEKFRGFLKNHQGDIYRRQAGSIQEKSIVRTVPWSLESSVVKGSYSSLVNTHTLLLLLEGPPPVELLYYPFFGGRTDAIFPLLLQHSQEADGLFALMREKNSRKPDGQLRRAESASWYKGRTSSQKRNSSNKAHCEELSLNILTATSIFKKVTFLLNKLFCPKILKHSKLHSVN